MSIYAATSDSNRDGVINEQDLQTLYVLDLNTKEVTVVNLPPAMALPKLVESGAPDFFFLHCGIDKNDNGQFEEGKEPKVFVQISRTDYRAHTIVSEQEMEKLQILLTGNQTAGATNNRNRSLYR